MPKKPESSNAPLEGLFGDEFQAKLSTVITELWTDNYAKRYTYHTPDETNVSTCTIIAGQNPNIDNGQPDALVILGHFDNYADGYKSIDCAAYTVSGRYPKMVITPQKGNFELFEDPAVFTDVNRIFSIGGKQPSEPEGEYFKIIAEKLKTY